MRVSTLLAALPLLAACSGITTSQDYDPEVDFSRLHTYAWISAESPEGVDSLTRNRIREAVDAELAAKGFTAADAQPDFQVAAHVTTRERVQVTDWGPSYSHRGWYYDAHRLDVSAFDEGTFVLDLIDPARQELLWRGTARAVVRELDPEEKTAFVREFVARTLAPFPPGR